MTLLERKLILDETDVPKRDKDKLAEACADSDFSHLRADVTDKFAEGITDDRISSFLSLLQGERINHPDVVELGNVLREYGASNELPKELNDKEVEVINFGIKYINSWLKHGGLTSFKDFNNENQRLSLDFATLSFIVNQLAKIKTLDKGNRIESIDINFISDLLEKSEDSLDEYFEPERFAKDIHLKDSRETSVEEEYRSLKEKRVLIEKEQEEILLQIKDKLIGCLNSLATEENLVIREFRSVASNPQVIEIMMENDIDLGGAWKKFFSDSSADKTHDLEKALDLASKLHGESMQNILQISQLKIEPSEQLKNYKSNNTKLKDAKLKIVSLEHEDILLRQQIETGRRNLANLDSIKNDIKESFRSVRQNIANDSAGSFYALKGLIAGIELARRETDASGVRVIDLRMKSLLKDKKRKLIMSFLENDQTKTPAWYKVHVYRRHMISLRFAAEYLLNIKNSS